MKKDAIVFFLFTFDTVGLHFVSLEEYTHKAFSKSGTGWDEEG